MIDSQPRRGGDPRTFHVNLGQATQRQPQPPRMTFAASGFSDTATVFRVYDAALWGGGCSDLQWPTNPPTWLNDVYARVARGESEEAADLLYERIDDLLLSDRIAQCDGLLRTIDLERLNENLLVALLVMTKPASALLPYRASLRAAVREHLSKLGFSNVEELVRGL